jgi:hypothetical protein
MSRLTAERNATPAALAAHAHPHRALMAAALLAALALLFANRALAAFSLTVNIAPPALPLYAQPPIPAPGYLWTPGYWAYGPEGYFWVPGSWIEPPAAGLLWTPGYWGFTGGAYVWNAGYWGPVVGFYGGVNYGFGYSGRGFEGGYWRNNQFYYNRTVTNISNVHITNVYNRTVVNNVSVSHVSYNGGPGGLSARPTAAERAAAHASHQGMTAAQTRHAEQSGSQHELLASVNHGHPPPAARGASEAAPAPAHKARAPAEERHTAPMPAREPAQASKPPAHPLHLAQAQPPHAAAARAEHAAPAPHQAAAAPHAAPEHESRPDERGR